MSSDLLDGAVLVPVQCVKLIGFSILSRVITEKVLLNVEVLLVLSQLISIQSLQRNGRTVLLMWILVPWWPQQSSLWTGLLLVPPDFLDFDSCLHLPLPGLPSPFNCRWPFLSLVTVFNIDWICEDQNNHIIIYVLDDVPLLWLFLKENGHSHSW